MEKTCQSSAEPTGTGSAPPGPDTSNSNNNGRDQYQLKQLHRISHKISKPIRKWVVDPPPPPPPVQPPQPPPLPPQLQNQPPVYNINKNDFRDVVQKLTGAPPHERISAPPPIHPPKPPSSRLQRIRPPPLSQIANLPPPLLHLPNTDSTNNSLPLVGGGGGTAFPTPLSPLPPLPSCHAAAESPITAYMRFLHGSISFVDSAPDRIPGFSPLAPLASPKFSDPSVLNPREHFASQQQQPLLPASSPLPFGCFPSPRSPAPLLSPSLQFAFPQLPISPTVPAVPSPK
ncbi:hypothetical protein Dimus_006172 [Dionaea muscipula]